VALTLPLIAEARKLGIPLSNDSQIFLEHAPCPVIGITGSAGKTTTTTLVGRMAEAAARMTQSQGQGLHPRKAWTGGNIGSPLIAWIDQMQAGDIAVMELSSFQLELMTLSPHIAAILNITPNHLDRHASMEEYTAAKARILDFQTDSDFAVLGREDPGAWAQRDRVRGKLLSFGLNEPDAGQEGAFLSGEKLVLRMGGCDLELMPRSLVQLRGEHNLMNVLAASAIAAAAGLPLSAVREGVEGFTGVAHRLELVRVWKGAAWYNDSIATAPERAMADIRSFNEPLVLLAGGKDKNLPWDEFAGLARERVRHIILFGEAGPKIESALQAAGAGSLIAARSKGLREAVLAAAELARPGDVVLLAPGGTSFDEFRDFEARGEAYRQWVMSLV
jgi:UDP-N-acetylmuramoylalanine--D-glutamate ligase